MNYAEIAENRSFRSGKAFSPRHFSGKGNMSKCHAVLSEALQLV